MILLPFLAFLAFVYYKLLGPKLNKIRLQKNKTNKRRQIKVIGNPSEIQSHIFLFFYLTLLMGKLLSNNPESPELPSSIIYGSSAYFIAKK